MSHAHMNRSPYASVAKNPSHDFEPWEARPRSRGMEEDEDDSCLFSSSPHHLKRMGRGAASSNSGGGRRKLFCRCFQVFSVLMVGISLYALVQNINYLIRTWHEKEENANELTPAKRFVNINEELQSWLIHTKSIPHFPKDELMKNKGIENASLLQRQLIDVESLSFNINNETMCKLREKSQDSAGIYFMILVHSAPHNFKARQTIRNTWGSVKSLKKFGIRIIFLMGKLGDWAKDSDLVQTSIIRESQLFGDIVSGNFVDVYKNLTYKHLLGYKWITQFCSDAAFVLKADDDVFIDIFQLFDFVSRTYGLTRSSGTLICNVFPEGLKPVRASDVQGTKWAVSLEEYPHSIYPKYCGGLAYLITPDLIQRLLQVSNNVRFFWIDDVMITGILRELIGVEPFYLNLRYSYNPDKYREWLNSTNAIRGESRKILKFPFLFTHVERGSKFHQEMSNLWQNTLKAWKEEHPQIISSL